MFDEHEHQDEFHVWRGRRKGSRGPVESIVGGAAFILACGVASFFIDHSWWMIFPAFFAGLLPVVRGITRLISDRVAAPREKRLSQAEKTAEAERAVLRIAQARAGIVTPSQVALDTKLSLEEAGLLLDSMAKRGYASMEVREDGRLIYRFSEFLPTENEPSLLK